MFIPDIYRPLQGKLQVFIPIRQGEGRTVRYFLRDLLGPGTHIDFNYKTRRWEVGRAHIVTVRDALVERFGTCTVTSDNRLSANMQCDKRCVEARGDECVCSCGGLNHRGTEGGYKQVGLTTLIAKEENFWTTRRLYDRDSRH